MEKGILHAEKRRAKKDRKKNKLENSSKKSEENFKNLGGFLNV